MVGSGTLWVKVGMHMLMGEYHHNLDDKSRLIIPSKFRLDLGEKFIITRGLEKCLFVYSLNEWENIVSKLKSLPFTKKDARNFVRFFLSGAAECEFDKQGRINITSPLVQYADIKKECVIIGVNERLEIWSKDNFESFVEENEEKASEIAENLFEMDINF